MDRDASAASANVYRLGWPYPLHLLIVAHPFAIGGAALGPALLVGGSVAVVRDATQSLSWLLLVLGLGGCLFALVATSRLCLRARIWPEGILTLRWIVRERSFDVLDVTRLYWRRPKDMMRVHPSELEPFVIEVGGQRIGVEAVAWAMREFAEAIRLHNPSVETDLPQFS